MLVEVPEMFIRDYAIQLKKNTTNEIEGWVKTNKGSNKKITIEIPKLKFKKEIAANIDSISFSYKLPKLQLWSPENPKLYSVLFRLLLDTQDAGILFLPGCCLTCHTIVLAILCFHLFL